MLSDSLAAVAGHYRRGPACALCQTPATVYCRQDDAFLCGSCDARVHCSSVQFSQHERVPTSNMCATESAAVPSQSAASGSACLSGAAAPLHVQLRHAPSVQSVPLAPQHASHPARVSPFSFNSHQSLQPPPPLPAMRGLAGWDSQHQYPRQYLSHLHAPPPVTSGSSLDEELLECLEGLCQDPLAPLDFGVFDLGHLGTGPLATAAELDALDSCMDCATPVEAQDGCAASEDGAATFATAAAAAAAATSIMPSLSSRSDCSTASRPGSAQLSPLAGSGSGSGSVEHSSELWRQYRPTNEHQAVVVEEVAPPPAQLLPAQLDVAPQAGAQRKRSAEGEPDGPAPPRSRLRGDAGEQLSSGGASQGAGMLRRWAAASHMGAVVTTGAGTALQAASAASAAAAAAAAAAISPGTPTSDDAGLPTTGSFVWQQPQQQQPQQQQPQQHLSQGSQSSAGGSLVPSSVGGIRAAGMLARAATGAVTTGAAEAAAALHRHAGAAAVNGGEPGLKLTVRVPGTAAGAAGQGSGQAQSARGKQGSSGDKSSVGGATPAAGARTARSSRKPRQLPRHPAAHAASAASQGQSDAAAASQGSAAGGSRMLPPIPPYREGETRADKLARYRAKRERRRFQKTVRYECRKHYADMRPRIKGRFVSPEEFAAWQETQKRVKDGDEDEEGCGVAASTAPAGKDAAAPLAPQACAVAAC